MTDLPHADYFYVNGERFDFQPDDKAWVELLLNSHIIDVNMHEKPPSFAFLETLTTLINKGYWEWLEA
jgi:50S ribosomal protein L16 3-hydroxylase